MNWPLTNSNYKRINYLKNKFFFFCRKCKKKDLPFFQRFSSNVKQIDLFEIFMQCHVYAHVHDGHECVILTKASRAVD